MIFDDQILDLHDNFKNHEWEKKVERVLYVFLIGVIAYNYPDLINSVNW